MGRSVPCIVVGIDFTDASRAGFDSATALARDLEGATLVLVHAYGKRPVPATVPDETLSLFRETEAGDLAALVHQLTEDWAEGARKSGVDVEVVVVANDPARLLVETARQRDAAMIVVGTKDRGMLARAILGSVAQEVIRLSLRPVLVVPHRT